jgi:hypothetical protein
VLSRCARDQDAANHVHNAETEKDQDHQVCFAQSLHVSLSFTVRHLTNARFRVWRWNGLAKVGCDAIGDKMLVAMNDLDFLSATGFVKCTEDRRCSRRCRE